MTFRTQVELPERQTEIRHSEQIMLFGSCFAENIGNLLAENKFLCDVNPFGILYNPISIASALHQLIEKDVFEAKDLFLAHGRWNSWMHHSDFSSSSQEETLAKANFRFAKAKNKIAKANWLMVTFGTAYVYIHKETQEVVANCHKMPERMFTRSMLDVKTIVNEWQDVLKKCREANPDLKVLFTVSPIRHAKDGLHGNQLSKATLLLAIDELCRMYPGCFYFPSYEILMDELRDYRFYADDMLHPSRVAVEYLWECFSKCYFSASTREVMKEWSDIRRGLEHKPFDPESEAYHHFLSQIVLKITRIKEKLPYLEVQKELELCECRLKI
jgi:hypothetical protein